jgi:hypothetical protein
VTQCDHRFQHLIKALSFPRPLAVDAAVRCLRISFAVVDFIALSSFVVSPQLIVSLLSQVLARAPLPSHTVSPPICPLYSPQVRKLSALGRCSPLSARPHRERDPGMRYASIPPIRTSKSPWVHAPPRLRGKAARGSALARGMHAPDVLALCSSKDQLMAGGLHKPNFRPPKPSTCGAWERERHRRFHRGRATAHAIAW